ncbi:unnamed protein product [Amoebophrya sp. A120]|nr:unnamed protein product [Amoebophrya sp. A120]|eukprot:GSA120T00016161001.1
MQTGGLGMLEEAETGAVETGTTRPRRSAGASSVLRRISSPVSSPRQQETTETGEAEPRMAFAAPSLPSGIMPDGASHGRRISPVPPTTRRATQGRRMHVDARAYPSARQEPGTCVGRVKNLFRRMWTSSAPASASSQACGPALSGPQAAAAAADAQRSAPPRGQPRDGQRMNPPAAAQDQRHGSSSSDVDQNGYSQDFVRMQLEAWSGCSAGAGGCPWLF